MNRPHPAVMVLAVVIVGSLLILHFQRRISDPVKVGDMFSELGSDPWCQNQRSRVLEIKDGWISFDSGWKYGNVDALTIDDLQERMRLGIMERERFGCKVQARQ